MKKRWTILRYILRGLAMGGGLVSGDVLAGFMCTDRDTKQAFYDESVKRYNDNINNATMAPTFYSEQSAALKDLQYAKQACQREIVDEQKVAAKKADCL